MDQIVKIDRRRLTNHQHYAYMKAIYALISSAELEDEKVTNAQKEFLNVIKAEDNVLQLPTGSELTPQIREEHRLRVKHFMSMKKVVESWLDTDSSEEAAAAEKLQHIIKVYRMRDTMQTDEVTSKIDNLVSDLTQEEMLAKVKLVGAEKHFNNMLLRNANVTRLLAERDHEKSTTNTKALTQARSASDTVYNKMVLLIEALSVTATDNEPYLRLIQEWNSTAARYKEMINRKIYRSQSQEEGEVPTDSNASTPADPATDTDNNTTPANPEGTPAQTTAIGA